MTDSLSELFLRELDKLKKEIQRYPAPAMVWETAPGTANSGGNLALHLIGNLSHFIGSVLGNDGYVRDRHAEFHDKDIPVAEIIQRIDQVMKTIENVLPKLSHEDLERTYPIVVFKEKMSTTYFLMHLLGHLNYHLGQINYHRRILMALSEWGKDDQ